MGIAVNSVAAQEAADAPTDIVDQGRREYVLQTQDCVLPRGQREGVLQTVVVGSADESVVPSVGHEEGGRGREVVIEFAGDVFFSSVSLGVEEEEARVTRRGSVGQRKQRNVLCGSRA